MWSFFVFAFGFQGPLSPDGAQSTWQEVEFRAESGAVVAAQAGELVVPENRLVKGGRELTLRFVVLPATGSEPGAPIVYLAGGPGGSGVEAGRGERFPMMNALRTLGDVVLFDQRGTGSSDGPPEIPGLPGLMGGGWSVPLEEAATEETIVAAARAGLAEAVERWQEAGVDLDAYDTEESADDVEALARALGAEKVRLVGISYGTHLALATMRRHPELVERAVLAGVEGPDHTFKLPSDQERMLERIAGWIAADPAAAQRYPDFLEALERVLARLDEEPVTVEKGSRRFVVSAIDVRRYVAAMLRGPQTFRGLPLQIYRLDGGDFAGFAANLSWLRRGRFRAMPLATDAASGASPRRWERIRREAQETLLRDAIDFPTNRIARDVPVPDLGEAFRSPVVSEIPVLAISGTADGRTPPSNAEEVLATLENGQHLVLDGAGHGDALFLSSPEILRQMMRFLDGEAPTVERVELGAPRFD